MSPLKLSSIAALSLASMCGLAQTTAFSNWGNSTTGGWLINPTDSPIFQFTSTATGDVSGFDVSIGGFGGPGAAFTLTLYADNGSNAPEVAPLSLGFVGTPNGTDLTYVAASGPLLIAGDKYWLQATSAGSDVWKDVSGGGLSSTVQNGQNQTPGPGFTSYNFGELPETTIFVVPQATPEPSTTACLGLGVVALAFRRRLAKS